MSDDKNKTDSGTGNGTGAESGKGSAPTTMGFGELLGHIDSRIDTILGKRSTKSGDDSKGVSGTGESDTQSVTQQIRTELAKLAGEDAAAKKTAEQETTLKELQDQVTKLSEAAPAQQVSKLTQLMWGGGKKKS